ncbi:MAG: surface lipoprotein assembly modifier [Bacteroidota bacterium]|nr:surface lipoprotein assembly modifier [Bacteroidota bacterium]
MSARILFVLAALAVSSPLQAQWLGTLAIESGYDDNMFRNYSATEATLTDISLMYGFFPNDDNWAVNYSGALSTFAQYPERLYSTHTLGASWAMPYGAEEQHSLTLMGAGNLRLDGADYELYDYTQLIASASLKQRFISDIPILASYRLRYRRYPNFGELSYLEHFASLGSSVFFETRTSIRVQADYGFKNYLQTSTMIVPTGGSGFAPSSTSGSLTVDGGGNGGGGNGGDGNGGGKGSPGASGGTDGWGGGNGSGRMGMGDHSGMEGSVQYLMYEEPSTSQLSAWINIGQGLTESTGLSLRLLQRWNLTDRGRAFVGGAVDFIGEEELFDDPYSYESSEASLILTQILGWGMKARIGGVYAMKTYAYPASLDYTDLSAPTREDERFGGYLTLEKTLSGSWLLFNGLTISLNYVYLRNQSNTTYYDYRSNALGLGVSTDF